ncbi:DUF4352 domain-containing protein [Microtetraspora fusca]|uniref:DUF4352 domain-containing protein n=1 Tax=Microtetraspora fusca TaxID=1997 RepID=UPI000829D47B|nr:DUF4352 domain-containing protein [Microtetraspora fusca]
MAVVSSEAEGREATVGGRERARRGGVARRVVGVVAGIAFAAAAVYAQTFTLSFDQRGSALTVKGAVGELVETNRFSAKVTSLVAAHAVESKDTTDKVTEVETSNLFLVVDVTATTPKRPLQLSRLQPPVLLTADDRRYTPTDKVDESLTLFNKVIQPGLWSKGVLVFEIPEDALPGLRFVLIPPQGGIVVDTFVPEAEIDLGLSDAAAARLVSQAERVHSLVGKS